MVTKFRVNHSFNIITQLMYRNRAEINRYISRYLCFVVNRACSCVSSSCVFLSADAPLTPPGHGTAWFRVKQKKVSKNKHCKLHLAFVISRESSTLKGPMWPRALCFHREKAMLKAPIYLLSAPHSKPHGLTSKNKVSTLHIQHRQCLLAD